MDNPGDFNIGSFSITTAGTQVGEWTTVDLDGMLALLTQMKFAYGSGGTSVKAYLQTTIDGGTTPIDIACVVFGVASEVAVRNFRATDIDLDQITPSDGALADDTVVPGVLGSAFRVKIVSVGTYAGSTSLVVSGNAK